MNITILKCTFISQGYRSMSFSRSMSFCLHRSLSRSKCRSWSGSGSVSISRMLSLSRSRSMCWSWSGSRYFPLMLLFMLL